ncbi:unnamed protein product [Cuscuta europaea]|uniref:Uncharacterized protein n=1 Tax=Cuscuta europaea TaxID=41803 RepID=A0A9P0YLK6_CUSEU|nr:unnamed protein product [Cuscuta europaea]
MGNYVSCALSAPASAKQTKVILPSGEIRHFSRPINAAEVMLESPNHFVVNSKSLQIGRRFSALYADEDLEIANVYAVFPMKRLGSAVTAADVAALFLAAKRTVVAAPGSRLHDRSEEIDGDLDQVDEDGSEKLPKLDLDEIIDDFLSPEFRLRMSMSRSKKPMLETIVEEVVLPR